MKIRKISIILIIIISLSLMFQINIVQAALQTNGNTPVKKDRNTWMEQIRKMENVGGGFGLQETQNSDLTPSSDSNGLDIHMQKNTEYGAMALLSASSYGKPDKVNAGETTTGNETGVVMKLDDWEWTAAQNTDYYQMPAYEYRYINNYGTAASYMKKNGDATLETSGWHESSNSLWAVSDSKSTNFAYRYTGYQRPGGLLRGKNGLFFYFNRATYIGTGTRS